MNACSPIVLPVISSRHPLTLEAGYLLGPYRILAPIGAGGMGEVYRARDTKLERDVALKILPPDVASAELLRRFEKEARAASSLNHPNIVSIYDVGRVDSIAYIAMELIEGQTLRGVMAGQQVPVRDALRIGAKVADVLASAHERGVTHRDLKPENVMISRDGYIKLLDFGLAKVRSAFVSSGGNTEPQTSVGHVFGTTSYMSPEQAAGKPVDFRSDQFSLGLILYEMLAQKRPFDRASGAETLTAIIREQALPLSQFNDAVPPELAQIIDRCLEKSPSDRYASTRDLARDLRELRNRLSLGTTSGRSIRSLRIETPRLPVLAAVTGALLVGVLASIYFNRPHAAPIAPVEAKSVAVVPFRDLSATGDGQLFSDGISEMISARIAQAHGVRVIAPFDGAVPANADVREIARRRGATMVLKGSVQRVGEQLRVSYQLVDATTGNPISGDMVTAPSADVFTLEDLVADSVLQSLSLSRTHRSPHAMASTLSGPDQRTYTETVGLLKRMNNVEGLDRAITSLEALLVNSRDSAAVNGALGEALLRKYSYTHGRELVDQAAVYAERAVQLDPADPQAHITVGNLRRISGHFPEAITSFQRALVLQPDSAAARLGLADTYDATGRAADADRLYKQALQLAPDLPDVYGRYGRFCYTRGRYEDAARLFADQARLLPNAPRAFSNLGAAQQALGHYEAAMTAYQQSIAIQPTSGGYSNLGTCQFYLGRYVDAAATYEKASALTPNDYRLWANLGDAYRWAPGQRERAVAAFDRAVRLAREAITVNPNDAIARAVAAACLAKRGDAAAASAELKLALQSDPTNGSVLYQAAVVTNIRGDHDEALAWLGRAIASGRSPSEAARDPELSNLRDDPRFRNALNLSKRKT